VAPTTLSDRRTQWRCAAALGEIRGIRWARWVLRVYMAAYRYPMDAITADLGTSMPDRAWASRPHPLGWTGGGPSAIRRVLFEPVNGFTDRRPLRTGDRAALN